MAGEWRNTFLRITRLNGAINHGTVRRLNASAVHALLKTKAKLTVQID